MGCQTSKRVQNEFYFYSLSRAGAEGLDMRSQLIVQQSLPSSWPPGQSAQLSRIRTPIATQASETYGESRSPAGGDVSTAGQPVAMHAQSPKS